jgi:hypothetical protein
MPSGDHRAPGADGRFGARERFGARLRRAGDALGRPWAAAALCLVLILAGALIWFRPFLTEQRGVVAAVPSPPPLTAISDFPVSRGKPACMAALGLEKGSQLVQFNVRPEQPGGPTPVVTLVLSAPGYSATAATQPGFPGGETALSIPQPSRSVIATACFSVRGRGTALIAGSTEGRTATRSSVTLAGKPTPGQITLAFLQTHPRALLDRLGTIFSHASNLTGRLVPTWLVWILALLTIFGVPAGICAALLTALREDERAAGTAGETR